MGKEKKEQTKQLPKDLCRLAKELTVFINQIDAKKGQEN